MSGERATAFQIRMMSIRKSLLLWLLSGLLLAGLFAGIATFLKTQEEVGEMFDYQLRQIALSMKYSARSMANQLQNLGEDSNEDNDFMVQIWDAKGTLLYSSIPSVKLPEIAKSGFANINIADGQWRVFNLISGNRVIQAAQPVESRAEASFDMALRMLLPLGVLIPVLALLALIAVKKSLLPLTKVTSEVERRNASSMTPLDINSVPSEIRPLLSALNSLLKRLNSSISSQRRFIADAAHELRTPMTALSLQVDLAEQADTSVERAEAIENLRNGIKRSSHLVSQLLTLARQEPEVRQSFEKLDLALLAKRVADDFLPLADFKKINLQANADQAVMIHGDEEGLRTVISNLVDNAIRYTPENGKVEISVAINDGNAVLAVRDTGPGILAEDRERIFERFYRIPGNNVTGSGLGLSIVKQIVERHKASIVVGEGINGKGVSIVIAFNLSS